MDETEGGKLFEGSEGRGTGKEEKEPGGVRAEGIGGRELAER